MTFLLVDNSKKYILDKFLGEGATCKCFLGYKETSSFENHEFFAIKIYSPKFYQYYINEVDILSKFSSNDNIIKLYENGEGYLIDINKEQNTNNTNDKEKKDNNKIYYEIMEYASNGELKDFIQGTDTRLPENISAKIFMNLVLTVKILHENNIAHCDIKPENVLMNSKFRPLLSDFGFSQYFDGENCDYTLHKFAGSDFYCAPETRKAYVRGFDGVKNDIFSLGVLLFVITIGDFPFHKASFSDDRYRYIIKKNYSRFWEHFNDIEISEEFKDLINNLICITPSQRFNIEQILEHPWFKKYITEIHSDKDNKIIEMKNNYVDEEVISEFNSRKI
jgi:serine/threonine protein kinase